MKDLQLLCTAENLFLKLQFKKKCISKADILLVMSYSDLTVSNPIRDGSIEWYKHWKRFFSSLLQPGFKSGGV